MDWLRKVSVLSQVVKFYEWERSTLRCDICPHLPLTSRKPPAPTPPPLAVFTPLSKQLRANPAGQSEQYKLGQCACRVQELRESRGGRPGLPALMSLTVSVDVKQH